MSARIRLLFALSIFLASFLLFLCEPIAARQLLPTFGGSAAVWMTCLVFFQVALLLGYSYAHALTRVAGRRQAQLHILLLTCCGLAAVAWASGRLHPAGPQQRPVLSIFSSLALTLGLPFVVLASTSPLLQMWFFRLEGRSMPFRLFALSNFGSLLALLCYPSLIEPHLSLSAQRSCWACGVALFAVLTAFLAARASAVSSRPAAVFTSVTTSPVEVRGASSLRAKLLWFLLPAVAAMQLSAVTAHLTSNIAAIPLLWILPLAIYLLTFILAFQMPELVALRGILLRLLAVMLASLGYILSHTDVSLPIGIAIGFFLLEAFLACLFCHAETYALRPQRASETTLFYLIIAAGGATGAFLVGIAFPLLFRGNYDLAITFLLTALLALAVVWKTGWQQRLLWATGSALLLFLVFALHAAYFHRTLVATRNFYGSLRVQQTVTEHGDPIRTLLNGSIQHGTQIFSPDLSHTPTSYYAHDSGVGLALRTCCPGRPKHVGVIGLGAGTVAAYGQPGDSFRFYEINPADLPIARNLFTWLRDSRAALCFSEGDARSSLAAEQPQHFDVLVVDAFSGDAIPLHLLTREALALYRRQLAPDGIIAFHISNQYVDLAPEIALLASASGMQARSVASPEDKQSGEFKATWILVAANVEVFDKPEWSERSRPIPGKPGLRVWTDDYTSLLPLVHW